MTNLWYFLLMAGQFVMTYLIIPLFGGVGAYHQAMGFSNQLGTGAFVVLELAWATLGNFNLFIPSVALGLYFVLWLIKVGVSVWLLIKSLIPFLS